MIMIDFKKLSRQIVREDGRAGKPGYMFIATDGQKKNGVYSVFKMGSKRSLLKSLVFFIGEDEDLRKEFTL